MSRHRLPVLVPSLFGLCAAGFAAEQPAPAPAPAPAPVTQGERVTATAERESADSFKPETANATKLELPIEETPQSITVIPRALMESQGSFSLRDAVRNAPGLTIASGEGGVTGDAFTIRGFSANGDIYTDGMRDNAMYFRDTFNLEQVEVLKGSSALLFGRGSVGGAINQVTRKPTEQWHADASLTAGTDSFWRGSVGVGGPIVQNALGGQLDAFYQDNDTFRDNIHVQRYGVAPTVVAKAGERLSVTLQTKHQREESDMDYGLPRWKGSPADVDSSTFYGFKDDDFQEYDVDQYTAFVDYKFNDRVKLRNGTRYTDATRNYRVNIPTSSVYAPSTGNGNLSPDDPLNVNQTGTIYNTDSSLDRTSISQALRSSEQTGLYNQTEVSTRAEADGRETFFLAGMELGRESYDYKNRPSVATGGVRRVSIFDPQQADSWGAGRADSLDQYSSRTENDSTTFALYAMSAVDLTTDLKAVLGVRWDRYYVSSIANRGASLGANGLPATVAETNADREDREWSPRAGLIYELFDNLNVYASAGTAFSPSSETINSAVSSSTSLLAPEKTDTIEAGGKLDLIDDRLLISGAVFCVEKHNARVTDPITLQPELDGDQRTTGVEAGAAGTITDKWKVFAGGSFQRAVYKKWDGTTSYTDWNNPTVNATTGVITYPTVSGVPVEGSYVTGVPNVSSSLWTTYDIGDTGLTIGGGLYHVGKRYVNQANTESLPSYVRFDATVGYSVRAADVDWNAQLNVFNVFDKVYYEASHTNFTTVGTPRAGQLTVGASF